MQQAIDIISNQLRGMDKIQALKQLGKIHEECMTTNKYGPNVLIDLLQLTEFVINGVVPCFIRPEPKESKQYIVKGEIIKIETDSNGKYYIVKTDSGFYEVLEGIKFSCDKMPEPEEEEIEKLEAIDESNRRFKLPESVLNITKEDIERTLNPNEIVKHVYSSGNVSYKCTCGTRFDEPAKEDNE